MRSSGPRQKRGDEQTDLALLTDGLRAEREQGITIDVAHRYFATPKRKFVIADTPGHIQYTRNMVTGASTANLALLLVDARKGVLEQTRRHALLSSLLRRARTWSSASTKWTWSTTTRRSTTRSARSSPAFAAKLEITDLDFVPISALAGDNVVERSTNMPWFDGQPLLGQLEDVHIASDRNLVDNRFPVQYVIRPQSAEHRDYRGFAGSVVGGIFKQGDEVMVLPSRKTSTIAAIDTPERRRRPGLPADGGDAAARGRARHLPRRHDLPPLQPADREPPLRGDDLLVRRDLARCAPGCRTSSSTRPAGSPAEVEKLRYRLDVDTLHRDLDAETLEVNDIGRVSIHTTSPLFFDEYRLNRTTGSFILVDPATDLTVAAGMIIGAGGEPATGDRRRRSVAENITFHPSKLSREERCEALGTSGATIWMTGLSGSGKSTIATAVEHTLVSSGRNAYMLDGDNLRHGLNADLGFSEEDRAENVRRVGEVAKLLAESGVVAIVSLVSPFRRRPRQGPRRPRGGRHPLLRGLRRHAAGGVRTARPEGPLREGPGRRDHRPDRRRQPLRGARAARS